MIDVKIINENCKMKTHVFGTHGCETNHGLSCLVKTCIKRALNFYSKTRPCQTLACETSHYKQYILHTCV